MVRNPKHADTPTDNAFPHCFFTIIEEIANPRIHIIAGTEYAFNANPRPTSAPIASRSKMLDFVF
jgi:hypothetical protein